MKKALRITVFGTVLLVMAGYLYFSGSTPVTENLDTYVYDLPFRSGTAHKVVQGYGGKFSHQHKAAIDFSMPVGTPIYAAREGVVYAARDTYDEGGPFPKYQSRSNYIMIRHADGSIGCYWHLKKDSVVARLGKVKKGQLIGYSGSTGFVLRPHLHFAVKKILNYEKNSFLRTKFRTSKGIELLEQGETYMKP